MISAFFNTYQTLDVISDHNKMNLIGIYMFKIYNKTLHKMWKLLIYKYMRMPLPKCVLLSLLLTWKVFLTWFLCFYRWLWSSKWLMGMFCVHINNSYTSDHQSHLEILGSALASTSASAFEYKYSLLHSINISIYFCETHKLFSIKSQPIGWRPATLLENVLQGYLAENCPIIWTDLLYSTHVGKSLYWTLFWWNCRENL